MVFRVGAISEKIAYDGSAWAIGGLLMYVFDTNVGVAALRSRQGASFLLLQAMRRELIVGAVSTALFLEYADALNRAVNQQAFWADALEVDRVLTLLASRLKPTAIYFQWRLS